MCIVPGLIQPSVVEISVRDGSVCERGGVAGNGIGYDEGLVSEALIRALHA